MSENDREHEHEHKVVMTDKQMDELAEKLAEAAWTRFTVYVGRSVLRNLLALLAVAAIGVTAFLQIKLGGKP